MTTIISLQNLCLDKIVLEFSRFYQAYCVAEDSCLKLKFEFLKKKFSFHIVQNLNEEHQLKTEYLDFLINKYLKKLDTRWLNEWSWESVSQKLAEIGPNIEDILFSDKPWDKILCFLPHLKRVCFLHCSDEFLVDLSKFCGCIEILKVTYENRVSEVGVEHVLKNMHNLQKIDIRYMISVPEVLYSMHKSNINGFEKVKPYNLTHLDLICMDNSNKETFNDILTVCVSVCPHLKYLTCPIYQKRHLDLCSQLQELEELKLLCLDESRLELNELLTLNGKKLSSLKINNFCISLSVLAQNCPHLNLLHMDKVDLQHDVSDSVPVFHNLEEIIFENFIFTEPGIPQAVKCLLASVPNLNKLRFNDCELVSSDIKTQILTCCEQCKLSIINFWDSDVQVTLLRDILITCSTLETLSLYGRGSHDHKAEYELKLIAVSLPNKPQVNFMRVGGCFSDCDVDDDSMMNEDDYYFDSDEDFEPFEKATLDFDNDRYCDWYI